MNFTVQTSMNLQIDPEKVFTITFNATSLYILSIFMPTIYLLDAVMSSEILKAKQKLGVTFNFDKQDIIDLTKISKMTMCRASEANSEK